jgi:hypothetical protein
LAATPKWKDDEENPPLSARKAIIAARKIIAKLTPYGKDATLCSPVLKLRESNGHWFWVVYFSADDFRQFRSTFPVVVLMDGVSLLPKKVVSPLPGFFGRSG